MVEIVVVCPHCRKSVRIPLNPGNYSFPCPVCGRESPVPDPFVPPVRGGSGPLVGEVISDCRVMRWLRGGTLATYYEGYDQVRGRPVVLKIYRAEWAEDGHKVSDALRLEMIVGRLHHPSIAAAVRSGVDLRRNVRYVVLDLLDHATLEDRVKEEGAFEERDALLLASRAADALSAIHGLGVVHRAVCPRTVLVDAAGLPLLSGFDVARFLPVDEEPGLATGTSNCLAPEQLLGEAVDRRTDVYSLGMTIYYALCGAYPFEGRGAAEVIRAILISAPVPLSARNPAVSGETWDLVERMLARAPRERVETCREVRDRIDRILGPDAPQHGPGRASPKSLRGGVAVHWSVEEFLAVCDETADVLSRPPDDWAVEDWQGEDESRPAFRVSRFHRDNQVLLIFLRRYRHDPTSCEEHLARFRWMTGFLLAHFGELEERGLVLGDASSAHFGARRALLEVLCRHPFRPDGRDVRFELDGVLRSVGERPAGEWLTVRTA